MKDYNTVKLGFEANGHVFEKKWTFEFQMPMDI